MKGRLALGPVLSRVVVIALVFLTAACASHGKDFQRPDQTSLILEQTTKAEVIARFGQPKRRTAGDVNGWVSDKDNRPAGFRSATVEGDIERLTYSFFKSGPVGIVDYSRRLSVGFWNDKLVFYEFSSSFPQDTTAFDENRAASFVRGKTTRDEAIGLLGRPGGEGVYPAVAKPGTRMISYLYFYVEALIGAKVIFKHLDLLFDSSDRLLEIYMSAQGT